jgi:hypothetical protein
MSKEQAAAELRQKINACAPELLTVIDSLKETFGASLKFIELSDGTKLGNEYHNRPGIPPSPPAPEPTPSGVSSLAHLKALEQQHIAKALEARAGSGGRPAKGRRSRVG